MTKKLSVVEKKDVFNCVNLLMIVDHQRMSWSWQETLDVIVDLVDSGDYESEILTIKMTELSFELDRVSSDWVVAINKLVSMYS